MGTPDYAAAAPHTKFRVHHCFELAIRVPFPGYCIKETSFNAYPTANTEVRINNSEITARVTHISGLTLTIKAPHRNAVVDTTIAEERYDTSDVSRIVNHAHFLHTLNKLHRLVNRAVL